MNKEEKREYIFAQLNSLPNAYQYVEVTNYINNLELENEKLKEKIKFLTGKKTEKKIYGEYKNVKLTEKEFQLLIESYGEEQTKQLITYLDEYIEMKGYKAKSHYLCIKKWVVEAVFEQKYKYNKKNIRNELIPEYMNKETETSKATPEEIAEMKKILQEFYEEE